MDKLRAVIALTGLAMLILIVIYGISAYLFYYNYGNTVESYYDLSNDASTATLKLSYLTTFKDKLTELHLTTGQSAIIFPTPYTSTDEQTKILDSLIDRLNKTSSMNESSFEYQQALYQISRNEFCEGTDQTTGCLKATLFGQKYAKEYGLLYHPTIEAIILIILFAVMFLCFGLASAYSF